MANYFSFDGKANRGEYWAVNAAALVIFTIIALASSILTAIGAFPVALAFSVIAVASCVYLAAITTVAARRCGDCNLNKWWTLTLFIPYLGFIGWIAIGCFETEPEQVDETQ